MIDQDLVSLQDPARPRSCSRQAAYRTRGLTTETLTRARLRVTVHHATAGERRFDARVRIDTAVEADWMRSGGLVAYLLSSAEVAQT